MHIDALSQHIIILALYLDSKVPGIVSEIWIDKDHIQPLRKQIPAPEGIEAFIDQTQVLLENETDSRRKKYLEEIVASLTFQVSALDQNISYADFSERAYGYRIQRVTEDELQSLVKQIEALEQKSGLSRAEIHQKYSLSKSQYQPTFEQYVSDIKSLLPSYVIDFPDRGFVFETTTQKPWGAFNTHTAPFTSTLTLNADITFTQIDLHRLASHEAYGGHHSELSHKDKLLVTQGRGEHGLVITFSPQTFVSEAIAEGMYVLLKLLDENDDHRLMGWYYDRLTFALQNLATFMFFDDKVSREEIDSHLKKYPLSTVTRAAILNFSTDDVFGRYAPVYYTAFNFLNHLYSQTSAHADLTQELFTQPCTPSLLLKKYGVSA